VAATQRVTVLQEKTQIRKILLPLNNIYLVYQKGWQETVTSGKQYNLKKFYKNITNQNSINKIFFFKKIKKILKIIVIKKIICRTNHVIFDLVLVFII